MIHISKINELRTCMGAWRKAGRRIALVPTMGNLHAGHLELVQVARTYADSVVASIYVNPTQFGEHEDFDAYPRTFEEDGGKLAKIGVDLLFAPTDSEVYPEGPGAGTRVEVPSLSGILCGASRPGHFSGVATVVTRLLNMVQPDVAVFGEKDYQQLIVIRTLVRDLSLPVEIVGAPTVREPDGVAMSSRNAYLSEDERQRAPVLYAALCAARDRLCAGDRDLAGIEEEGRQRLVEAGFRPDYFSVVRAADLGTPDVTDTGLAILAAAWLGKARLIDNVVIQRCAGTPYPTPDLNKSA